MSGLINKVKEAVHEHKEKKEYEKEEKQFESHEGRRHDEADFNRSSNHGPHDSNLMNKADPRFDSDRDHRSDPTRHNEHHAGGPGGFGSQHERREGPGGFGGNHSSNHGTHDSNLMNKADPRFDSDRDHRADPTRHNEYNAGGPGGFGQESHGRHESGPGGFGRDNETGYGGASNHGPHSSNMMNSADPRVDSDRDGRAGFGRGEHATPGSGRAQETAGPHNSNLMNKADPRVDSDMDGSNTYGGDRTRY